MKNKRLKWPRHLVATLRASHQHPSHQPAVLHDPSLAKKGMHVASGSNQLPVDHQMDNKKKEATDKEVLADTSDLDKRVHVSVNLETK
jgi:hypothetical protein